MRNLKNFCEIYDENIKIFFESGMLYVSFSYRKYFSFFVFHENILFLKILLLEYGSRCSFE